MITFDNQTNRSATSQHFSGIDTILNSCEACHYYLKRILLIHNLRFS